jgi:DNA repair photolyase
MKNPPQAPTPIPSDAAAHRSHRGAGVNPANRFLPVHREIDQDNSDLDPADEPDPRTVFLPDHSQSALSHNDSPDVGFDWSVNPYRGCEHGCAYCYARPTHEYLGYSAGIDFETKILVKHDAPRLLRQELSKPGWKPAQVNLSGVTDCYQPKERELRLTRGCLEVLAEFRNPVSIVTKNSLVTRDIDLLAELARVRGAAVFLSVTSLDPELRRRLEPRASPPAARLRAIGRLAAAGIPVGVLIGPVIPAINDHEIPRIVAAAVAEGASFASYNFLRLPGAVAPVFDEWLSRHFPDRREKVLAQVRSFRDGALNRSDFRERMRGTGPAADRLSQLFHTVCRRHGIDGRWPELSTAHFRRIEPGQRELW